MQDPDTLVEAKLDALIELRRKLGDQKIDLVIRREQAPRFSFIKSPRKQGFGYSPLTTLTTPRIQASLLNKAFGLAETLLSELDRVYEFAQRFLPDGPP